METETKTWTGDWVAVRPHAHLDDRYVIDVARDGTVVNHLTVKHDDLQAIVQAAYDQHGILATPDIEREAARVAENMAGLCRCGDPNCSDRDTALRAFADRWGQSLRGRS